MTEHTTTTAADGGHMQTLWTRLRYHFWLLVLLWTGCVVASLLWNLHEQEQKIVEIARNTAQVTFENDVLYRRWAAKQGGVYVPVSEHTPPNPYLLVPTRDIVTTGGLSLTLVNPAYMARQVNQMMTDAHSNRGHITSLRPLRPENSPDPWERDALNLFEGGAKEVSSVEIMEGDEYIRLMRPFVTEQGCLKCHASQGYKEGDIRGGISVSIPMAPLWAIERPHVARMSLAHFALWLLGIAGIVMSKSGLQKQTLARERAEMVLRTRLRLSELAQNGGMEDLLQEALHDAELHTGSAIAYFHFTDADQKNLPGQGWSPGMVEHTCQVRGEGPRDPICEAGLWEDCFNAREPVIHNEPAGLLQGGGMLEGDAPLVRDMAVPILRGGAVVAVMGVANKPTPYCEDDVNVLRELASLTMDLVAVKQAEQALRDREEQLRLFVEHAPAAIAMFDLRMRYLAVSRRWLADYGLTGQEILGRSHYDIFPEIPERWKEIHRRCLAGAVERAEEDPFERADGSMQWIRWEARPWQSAPDKVGGIIIFSEDVTAHKQAESRLRHAADELARSNKDLEQFAYVASHDLQEPLRQVSSFVTLLRDRCQGKLDSSADEYIKYAVDGASRMSALITDLLTYSRVGSKGMNPRSVNLREPLDRAMALLGKAVAESGAKITVADLPTVDADGGQLSQVFQNLVGNALKFRSERPLEIEIGARRKTGDWVLWVKDNGIGLDPAQGSRVFELFRRLHDRGKYPGTGIGLAICKKIVERHGGRIWVESVPGEGSTFFFTIACSSGIADAPC